MEQNLFTIQDDFSVIDWEGASTSPFPSKEQAEAYINREIENLRKLGDID